jgi:hypothetical protein
VDNEVHFAAPCGLERALEVGEEIGAPPPALDPRSLGEIEAEVGVGDQQDTKAAISDCQRFAECCGIPVEELWAPATDCGGRMPAQESTDVRFIMASLRNRCPSAGEKPLGLVLQKDQAGMLRERLAGAFAAPFEQL